MTYASVFLFPKGFCSRSRSSKGQLCLARSAARLSQQSLVGEAPSHLADRAGNGIANASHLMTHMACPFCWCQRTVEAKGRLPDYLESLLVCPGQGVGAAPLASEVGFVKPQVMIRGQLIGSILKDLVNQLHAAPEQSSKAPASTGQSCSCNGVSFCIADIGLQSDRAARHALDWPKWF